MLSLMGTVSSCTTTFTPALRAISFDTPPQNLHGRILHCVNIISAGRLHRRINHRPKRSNIGLQLIAKIETFPKGNDGESVIAERTGYNDLITNREIFVTNQEPFVLDHADPLPY